MCGNAFNIKSVSATNTFKKRTGYNAITSKTKENKAKGNK
jgi:hypothetical protein